MNESHKELLRHVRELFEASERRITASYDRIENSIENAIDNCRLAMGGTGSSSSTSAWSDGRCVSEVPAPASSSPDTDLIVAIGMDVEDLATPTPTNCSVEGLSRDNTELKSASAPATVPMTPTATVDISPVLAAAAASDGTLHGEASSGVTSTPATCSMDCLPRQPVVVPALVTSSSPTPTEYFLDTNSVHVAAVPLAITGEFSVVLTPTSKVTVHRPMPWPSFMGVHADGDETRPLPWPSFRNIMSDMHGNFTPSLVSNWCSTYSNTVVSFAACPPEASFILQVHKVFTGLLSVDEHLLTCLDAKHLIHGVTLRLSVAYAEVRLPFGSAISSAVAVSLEDGIVAVCLNLNADCASFVRMIMQRTLLALNRLTSLTYGRLVVSSTIGLQLWFGHVLNREVEHVPFVQTATVWDSGQHVSYDQLSGAFQNVSCWPGIVFTLGQLQVNDACSPWQLFLSGSSISLPLVKFLVQAKEPYDIVLYVSELAGAKSVSHKCQLQCVEAIFAYPLYCPSFSSASEGSAWEGEKLELNNWVSYTAAQYTDQCSGGIKTGLHALGKKNSRELMQGISHSNEGSYRFDAIVLSHMGFPAVYTPIHVGCTAFSQCDASYSRKVELYMAARELLLLQHGIYSWVDSKNMAYAGHAWLSHGFVLGYLLDVQLLPTWSPPVAYCSIASNRFSYLDLSILAICEVWLLNHLDMMQLLIGWPPRVHADFITRELSNEDNSSCCFLCWYEGRPALFLLLAFDRQVFFQGGRWDPGHDFYFYLVAVYPNSSYYCDFDIIKDRQLQWDPGRFAVMSAWGQAEFQGGRGVRDPYLYMGCYWVIITGLAQLLATSPARCYIYEKKGNVGLILGDHDGEPALSLVSLLL